MGLFNRFKKDGGGNSTGGHDFSVEFKKLYEEYENASYLNKPGIFDRLVEIRDSWSFESPDDSNFQFANVIVGKINKEHMDFKRKFETAEFEHNVSNEFLFNWYRDKASELLNLLKDKSVSSNLKSNGTGFDDDFFSTGDLGSSGFDDDFFGADDSRSSGFDDDFFGASNQNESKLESEFFGAGMNVGSNSDFLSQDDSGGFDSDFFGTGETDFVPTTKGDDKIMETGTFSYLDSLIHSGQKEIILDSDITYDDVSKFKLGIKIDMDDLVIDGNGHTIDGTNNARIFYITGKNIIIKNVTLKNGYTTIAGGAISTNHSDLRLINVEFVSNNCVNGGAIYNSQGEVTIEDSQCCHNTADRGGVIFNEESGNVKIINTKLNNNSATNGGAIFNVEGKITLEGSDFSNNSVEDTGGCINNQVNGILTCTDVDFLNNEAGAGGAVSNFGELTINEGKFKINTSTKSGGAIYNHIDANLEITGVRFEDNRAILAGAIMNYGKLKLRGCHVENNASIEHASAIYSELGGKLEIVSTDFIRNVTEFHDGELILNNSSDSIIKKCNFIGHSSTYVIHNLNYLECYNSVFNGNHPKEVISNDKSSTLIIYGGEFKNNRTGRSAIVNGGKLASISKCMFEDNESDMEYCDNILNLTELNLTELKIENEYECIYNNGHIKFKGLKEEIMKLTPDLSGVEIIEPPTASKYGFYYLEQLIHENPVKVTLNDDIVLNHTETDMYGGGIELDIDGLEIDGAGKCIDAKGLSRIFTVTGENITLKNITFKNGSFSNRFEEHTSGGGAIYIVQNGSLKIENCSFMDNESSDDGGAILNRGKLDMKKSKFENNHSDYYGGAIHNKGILTTEDDTFDNNDSKLGSSIYNKGILNINNKINMSNNSSDFDQPIYNVNIIKTSLNIDDSIYPCMDANRKSDSSKSFSYLYDIIQDNEKISLSEDILFDFEADGHIKSFDIDKHMVIDGNGFSIDGNNVGTVFRISKLIHVVFRNIVFRNFNLNSRSIIENEGEISIINCRFINNLLFRNSLIDNRHQLTIRDSSFMNNTSKNDSLIHNRYELEISGSNFINNDSYSQGAIVANELKTIIVGSTIKSNKSRNIAGVINNLNRRCDLRIIDSHLTHNSSINGGTIVNYGSASIMKTEFHKNISKQMGGGIYNSRVLDVHDSTFSNNIALENGGAIFNEQKANIKAVNCRFLFNQSKNGGAIKSIGQDNVHLEDCKFEGNIPGNL